MSDPTPESEKLSDELGPWTRVAALAEQIAEAATRGGRMSEHTVAVIHVVEWIGWVTVEAESVADAKRVIIRTQPEIEWAKHRDYNRFPPPHELEKFGDFDPSPVGGGLGVPETKKEQQQ